MARKKVTALTADDVEFVKELAREVYSRERGRGYHPPVEDLGGPVWNYVVYSGGGIPALAIYSGVGTGTGTGTTGAGDLGNSVSYAECDVYRLELHNAGYKELVYADFSIVVHNLMSIALPAGIFFVPKRDPWGDFYVDVPLSFGQC